MEARQKDLIDESIQILVESTPPFDTLFSKFLEFDSPVFNDYAISVIKNKNSEDDKKKELFMRLKRCGPDAFSRLTHVLTEFKCTKALEALKPKGGLTSEQIKDLPFFITNPDLIKVKSGFYHSGKEYYKMTSWFRGFALVVNIENYDLNIYNPRGGSKNDFVNTIKLWQELGFQVTPHSGLSRQDFVEALEGFRDGNDWSKVDCAVVVVMTHGLDDYADYRSAYLIFKDNLLLSCRSIWDKFSPVNCPQLEHKPKLFFFVACRGNKHEEVVAPGPKTTFADTATFARHDIKASLPEQIHEMSDTLVVFGSFPGFVTYRDDDSGNWFCNAMVVVFSKFATDYDLEELLKGVQALLDRRRDSPTNWRQFSHTLHITKMGFLKKLYFNPLGCSMNHRLKNH